jgi:hypothetical protein
MQRLSKEEKTMNDKQTTELENLMDEYVDILNEQRKLKTQKENLRANIMILLKTNDITHHTSPTGAKLVFTTTQRRVLNKELLTEFLHSKERDLEEFKEVQETERLSIRKETTEAE